MKNYKKKFVNFTGVNFSIATRVPLVDMIKTVSFRRDGVYVFLNLTESQYSSNHYVLDYRDFNQVIKLDGDNLPENNKQEMIKHLSSLWLNIYLDFLKNDEPILNFFEEMTKAIIANKKKLKLVA